MIKVVHSGDPAEDIRRITLSINYSEVDYPLVVLPTAATIAAGAATFFGGPSMDRAVFRRLLPDARWLVYAYGFATTNDANTVTIGLYYQTDVLVTTVLLGSINMTGAPATKQSLGPFDVFATGGVPAGEAIPMIRLGATKNVAGTATLTNWTIWLRLIAPRQ